MPRTVRIRPLEFAQPESNLPATEDLRALASRIYATDPSRAKELQAALRGHKTPLVQRIFKTVDRPRATVVKALFGKEATGKELLAEAGVTGTAGSVGGFLTDVLLDPLTYLTLGTAGIGKTAAKIGLKDFVLKEGGQELAERAFQGVATRGGIRRGATHSEILRRLGEEAPELAARIPGKYAGGVGLQLPFSQKRKVLIPGTRTSKATTKLVGGALDIVPGVNKALNAITSTREGMVGIRGIESTLLAQQARLSKRESLRKHKEVINTVGKVFPTTDKGKERLLDLMVSRPGILPASEAEGSAVTLMRDYLDVLRETAEKEFPDIGIGYIDDYFPFLVSPETRELLYGRGFIRAGKVPTSFKGRELPFKDPRDANKYMKEKFGIDNFFDAKDPHSTLFNYMRAVTNKLHERKMVNTAVERGLWKHTFDTFDLEKFGITVPLNELQAVGFTRVSDAVESAVRNIPDGRLDELAAKFPQARQSLDQAAEALRSEMTLDQQRKAFKTYFGKAKEGNLGGVPRLQSFVDSYQKKLDDQIVKGQEKMSAAAAKGTALDSVRSEKEVLRQEMSEAKKQLEALKDDEVIRPDLRKAIETHLGKTLKTSRTKVSSLIRKERDLVTQSKRSLERVKDHSAVVQSTQSNLGKWASRLEVKNTTINDILAGIDPKKGSPWPVPTQFSKVVERLPNLADDWSRIDGTVIGPANGMWAPKEVASELIENARPQNLPKMFEDFDRVLGVFKSWVTIPFPGFHVRNILGGMFNNYLGGVRTRSYSDAIEILLDMRHISKGELPRNAGKVYKQYGGKTGQELMELFEQQGITSPLQIQILGEQVISGRSPTELGRRFTETPVGQLAHAVKQKGGDVATASEGFLRGAAFLHGLTKFDGNVDAARAFYIVRHGDYSDVTSTERFIRMGLPFYKWMRTNVPLQVQSFLEVPGRQQNVRKFVNNFLEDQDKRQEFEEEGGLVSQFIADRGGFLASGPLVPGFLKKTPTFIGLDLPVSDINQLSPKDIIAQSVAAPLIEAATGQRLMGEGDLKGPIPLPKSAFYLRAFEKIPGLSQFFSRSAGGDLLVDKRLLRATQTLNPGTRFQASLDKLFPATQTATGEPTAASQVPPYLRPSSELFGVRITPETESSQQFARLRAENQLEDLIADLYRRGFSDQFKQKGSEFSAIPKLPRKKNS